LDCLTRNFAFACLAWLLLGCATEPHAPAQPLSGWSSVTVGVADMDTALQLWVDTFGMTLLDERRGADAGQAVAWGINAGDIVRQALVATGTHRVGMIHFVEFADPDPPVRAGAAVYDLLPKNLDVYVDNMPRRFGQLQKQGYRFRTTSWSEVTAPDGTAFREVHMPSHDDINVVILEVVGKEMPFTPRGFGGVGPLIYIVPDALVEKEFVERVLGLEKLNDNLLKGPEIERMIGLPPGAGLDVSIWGRTGNDFGDLEVIEYQGVEGEDRYPRATPKALGVLHVSYVMTSFEPLRARLLEADIPIEDHGHRESILGLGTVYSFATPSGLRIEVLERAP